MRRLGALLAMAVVTAIATTGCGVSGGSDGGPVEAMLGRVADTPANRQQVVVVDYARAREVLGIDQPPTDPSDAQLTRLLQAYGPSSPNRGQPDPVDVGSPSLFLQGNRVDEFRRAIGFSLVDADQEISAGQPPDVVTVVTGRIDPDRVEKAVTTDPEWKDDLERADHGGGTYYRWGPERRLNPDRIGPVRPVGVGGRLSVEDGVARWSNADAPLEGALDADQGERDSLADDDDMAAAARVLDGEKVLSAVLTDAGEQFAPTASLGPRVPPAVQERLGDMLGPAEDLPDWRVAAVADAVGDDDKPRVVLVFLHDDGDSAKAHVAFLRKLLREGTSFATQRPLKDLVTIQRLDADGPVVTAVLETDAPGLGFVLFARHEVLLAHR